MSIFDLFSQIENNKPVAAKPEFLIVGLGNPGKKYEYTRHNIGFINIDYIASKLSVKIDKMKFKALICEARIGDKSVILMKPQTFMNLSGEAVLACRDYYNIPFENVIIIYDDISLPVGTLRIREKGSAGGQNGMKSIITLLKTDIFPRVKIGIGDKPHKDYNLADWVLSNFTKDEMEILAKVGEKVYSAVTEIVTKDVNSAKQLYNGSL